MCLIFINHKEWYWNTLVHKLIITQVWAKEGFNAGWFYADKPAELDYPAS